MQSRLEYLFNNYVQQSCSLQEEKELMEYLEKSENKGEIQGLLDKFIEETNSEMKMPAETADSILRRILAQNKADLLPKKKKTVQLNWLTVAAAAIVILFISEATYWFFSKSNKGKTSASIVSLNKKSTTILPGGNHAILTLGDGSTVVLDSVQNGSIKNGISKVNKKGDLLVYDGSTAIKRSEGIVYNTLTTPKGGQYKVVLADGTQVWLNAASSLHFPTAFIGKERNVELEGEAYFEVAKNKQKPFHVNVDGMQVEVLGTHFDVNAYADDGEIKTSLLEGSVKINIGTKSSLIKPGQQCVLQKDNNNIKIKSVDMNGIIAWKNGLFQFDGANINNIMAQIGRWYNVDIIYVGKIPNRRFEGIISRDAQLADVLKILELSDIKFKIEGKKIIVE